MFEVYRDDELVARRDGGLIDQLCGRGWPATEAILERLKGGGV